MNIKLKLLLSYILIILLAIHISTMTIRHYSEKSIFEKVKEKNQCTVNLIHTTLSIRDELLSKKVISDLYFSEKLLESKGVLTVSNSKLKSGELLIPTMLCGKKQLNASNSLVKQIKQTTNAIASIFVLSNNMLIRVSTNISTDSKSAYKNSIPSYSEIYKKIIKGYNYYGKSYVYNNWYIAGYHPLFDKDKKVIGAIGIGYRELDDYLKQKLSDIKIGSSGYVYIIDSNSDVLLHPDKKINSLRNYDFTKKIIASKSGEIEYKFNGVDMMATYKYFKPWNCYIVAAANYNDLYSSSRTIGYISIVAGIIAFLVALVAGIILLYNFIRPVNELTRCMKAAEAGDSTIQCKVYSNDEIGILSSTFNKMIKENHRLLEETKEYDKLKTDFMANVSHELRTPLSIIFSTIQILNMNIDNNDELLDKQKTKKYYYIIKQNCYRLLRQVNNLIDITKIDSGYMKINLKNTNIVDLVEDITQSTVNYVESKHRNIIFDTDTEEKIMAVDGEKIERVILNLISNAVKFTNPDDTITVTVLDKDTHVIILVKDTGVGIPKQKQKIIFERFKQANALMSREHEGSGIGLSLAKLLIEMHEGTISIESEYGKGSEFIIKLPVKIISEPPSLPKEDYSAQNNVEKINIEFSDIYD